MAVDQREALLAIKRFDQLIAYLRDELGWPISKDSFDDADDLFYDFSAEELGIDPKTAAKIQEIKRLRPLSAKQPWGIFFVKFEPKKLPVVALRRILSQVALKKRASANSSERTAWSADDLLFISNYGEGDERQISFAHFSQPTSSDLPTLRVLGWNNLDTPLHLDAVAIELTQNLRWPDDDVDLDKWRSSWSNTFKLGHNEVINTAKDLSIRLAGLASSIRDRIKATLAIESESGPLTKLMKAFQSSLVQDLSVDSFADMYAQTIAYGLLSARITDPSKKSIDDFTSHMRTSPFLKELMDTFLYIGGRKGKSGGPGIDFDELGVGDVIHLLDNANMEAVIRDFGDRNRQEDPVMHFFEGFLQEYDSKIRKDRGVFYTPQPIVSYIVRSIHELIQTEFDLEDGLADTTTWGEMLAKFPDLSLPLLTDAPSEVNHISPDEPFIQILDPATGTSTFIVEVIDVIFQTLKNKWEKQKFSKHQILDAWNAYVPKHLLPRLYAFELMMAPYAIAHMKISLKLAETGYKFLSEARAQVYLTNALEPWVKQIPFIDFMPLAHEAAAVNEIKRNKRFTIILGNPPYSGHSRNNEIKSIVDLVKDYTRQEPSLQGPGQGKWLQDDYVKFLRLSQYLLSPCKFSILGMITNHRYLTNRTFKGMRRVLQTNFPVSYVLDLHGNNVVHEVSPSGTDENVFDIEQGVAIGFFVRSPSALQNISHYDLWGSRVSALGTGKYDFLAKNTISTTKWTKLVSSEPDWLFSSQAESNNDLRAEFENGIKMSELMPGALGPNNKPQSGLATMHDNFAISFSPNEINIKISEFLKTHNREEAVEKFGTLCNPGQWDYEAAKRALSSDVWQEKVISLWFSPFDKRYTVFDKSVAVHLRKRLSDHFYKHNNIGIVIGESGQEISGEQWDAVCCVDSILQLNYFRRNGSPTLPLYLYEDDLLSIDGEKRINLSMSHLEKIAKKLSLEVNSDGFPIGLTPEGIFEYTYAIFFSPSYRIRFSEFLKTDFPRLFIAKDIDLFNKLSLFGKRLMELHLCKTPEIQSSLVSFIGEPCMKIEKISWEENIVWIDRAKTAGFKGISEDVWNFHIGGYQICDKWLKDRKERELTTEDINHYKKIVFGITETIQIMFEIDLVIEESGGWPSAFINN